MSEAYNVREVAEKLKISTYAVKKLIKDNKLKAYRTYSRGYIVNEKNLQVFLGKKIEDLIDKKEFESYFIDCNELYNGKVNKEKCFEYFCSLFTPGPDLPHDYYMIKDTPEAEPIYKETQNNASEELKSDAIHFTKSDIIILIESIDKIKQILVEKIKS